MQRRGRKPKSGSSKTMMVKQCPLCWALFSTRSKHRRFCSPKHTSLWHQYQHLLKKQKEGTLRDWEAGFFERLERFIERERIANLEVIKNLRGSEITPQAAANDKNQEVNSDA